MRKCLTAFSVSSALEPEGAHIINGHVPVKSKDGESPLKCGGKLLVIDGGFSRAYQKETGIAGYTLIYNSYGLILAAHDPFESTEAAIERRVTSTPRAVWSNGCRSASVSEIRISDGN